MADEAQDPIAPTLALADKTLLAGTPWRIAGDVKEDADLSGIACLDDGFGLLVTDEGSLVQAFTRDREARLLRLHAQSVELLRAGEEADLEGLCCDGTDFYAIGSHASGRKQPDHQPSRHHVYRIRREDGELRHEISHGLEPLLVHDGLLGRHYRRRLDATERGVDIEGIAAWPEGRLLIGLRSPSLDGQAYLLSVAVETLFGAKGTCQQTAERFALPLGEGCGIRDLAALPGGVLILAGPSTDQDRAAFTLWRWGGRRKAKLVGTFVHAAAAKAEGLLVLEATDDRVEILVLFDGVKGGHPHQFSLPWRS